MSLDFRQRSPRPVPRKAFKVRRSAFGVKWFDMRIAITGASGLVGSALVPFLRGNGHEVLRLVRATPRATDEHRWDPDTGIADVATMTPLDAVVHLAGESVAGGRWTPAFKARIRDS